MNKLLQFVIDAGKIVLDLVIITGLMLLFVVPIASLALIAIALTQIVTLLTT